MAELQTKLDIAVARTAVDVLTHACPILTLPPEITSEIFLEYVSGNHLDLMLPSSYRYHCGPPLLATICRAWRTIALGLPAIWSNIALSPSTKSALFQCCVARARRHLLTLDIAHRDAGCIFDLIAPHSMQWEVLRLYVRLPVSFPMNEIRGRIPFLEKLTLVSSDHPEYIPRSPFITAFFDAPLLREVNLTSVPASSILLPWAQLTSLGASMSTPPYDLHDAYRIHDASPPILLDSLHTLEIRNPLGSLDFFDGVTLPALANFSFGWYPNYSATPPTTPLLAFLARSECQLHTISLIYCKYDTLAPILAAVPTVHDVFLCHDGFQWDDVLQCLERLTTDPEFLPNMKTLRIRWLNHRSVSATVVEMLESRWSGRTEARSSLKSFQILGEPEAEPELGLDFDDSREDIKRAQHLLGYLDRLLGPLQAETNVNPAKCRQGKGSYAICESAELLQSLRLVLLVEVE
ncbi:hypothetical protein C8F04DRAFT_1275345 [Mycena alexandri]|uniref:F-box domain-containing protein n=1 Tax=Mycena alexandri TaxID=1745969 RepID=A0AAD6WPA8_9AGAR|nr:hypothetical protein C8F04DRAFT_1275345 [Mycena alexandri]